MNVSATSADTLVPSWKSHRTGAQYPQRVARVIDEFISTHEEGQ